MTQNDVRGTARGGDVSAIITIEILLSWLSVSSRPTRDFTSNDAIEDLTLLLILFASDQADVSHHA